MVNGASNEMRAVLVVYSVSKWHEIKDTWIVHYDITDAFNLYFGMPQANILKSDYLFLGFNGIIGQ